MLAVYPLLSKFKALFTCGKSITQRLCNSLAEYIKIKAADIKNDMLGVVNSKRSINSHPFEGLRSKQGCEPYTYKLNTYILNAYILTPTCKYA